MKKGHSVLAVANQFLEWSFQEKIKLTPMHLQKLCYISHGFCLAVLKHPLTSDPIEAWDFGPVFPRLYNALKRYGADPVMDLIHEKNWALSDHVKGDIVMDRFEDDEAAVIRSVAQTYGHFEAFQLSALTHEADSPWSKIYVRGSRSKNIPNEMIKNYFDGLNR